MIRGTSNRSKYLIILMTLVAVMALAQVYKWVDDDGQVHPAPRGR